MLRVILFYVFLAIFYSFINSSSIVEDIVKDSNAEIEYANIKSVYKLTRRLDNISKKFNLDHQRKLSYAEALQGLWCCTKG